MHVGLYCNKFIKVFMVTPNNPAAFRRPQRPIAHLSAFTIRLSQYSSNGVVFLFWRSLTTLKWQEKARGLCVIPGQYQFDIRFPWCSITVIFCFPLGLCDSAGQSAQAGGKWWMWLRLRQVENDEWQQSRLTISGQSAPSSNIMKKIAKGLPLNEQLFHDVLCVSVN